MFQNYTAQHIEKKQRPSRYVRLKIEIDGKVVHNYIVTDVTTKPIQVLFNSAYRRANLIFFSPFFFSFFATLFNSIFVPHYARSNEICK